MLFPLPLAPIIGQKLPPLHLKAHARQGRNLAVALTKLFGRIFDNQWGHKLLRRRATIA